MASSSSSVSSLTLSDSNISDDIDIFDEQLFYILKQFLVSKSGKNIADCIEDLNENLKSLTVSQKTNVENS